MAIDYGRTAAERARTRARRAARLTELSFLRRLDWLLAARRGRRSSRTGSGRSTASRTTTWTATRTTSSSARRRSRRRAPSASPSRSRSTRPSSRATGVRSTAGRSRSMLLVFLAGPVTRGSRRWLDVGSFRFQPSEFGKLLFVLALAGFLAERAKRMDEPRTTLSALVLAALPVGARLHPARLRHRARLRRRARGRALRRRARAG